MLKTIGLFNKPAPNRNDDSKLALSKNNDNKLASRKNNGNNKVDRFGIDGMV